MPEQAGHGEQPLTVPCHAVQVAEGPHPNQAVLLVLFGTEYGFSKEVAERLCSELGRLDDGLYWWAPQLWLRQQSRSCIACAEGRTMRSATCVSAAACCMMTQHIIMIEPLTRCSHRVLLACPHAVCNFKGKACSSDMPASILDVAQPTSALLRCATCMITLLMPGPTYGQGMLL